MKRFLPFAFAGAIGYMVDAGVLSLAIGLLGAFGGRLLSFACAVITTWMINRRFAFADRATSSGKRYELLRYGIAMIPGGLINWAFYGFATLLLPSTDWRPAVAVAFGSLAGLTANLTAAHTLVFRAQR